MIIKISSEKMILLDAAAKSFAAVHSVRIRVNEFPHCYNEENMIWSELWGSLQSPGYYSIIAYNGGRDVTRKKQWQGLRDELLTITEEILETSLSGLEYFIGLFMNNEDIEECLGKLRLNLKL